MTDKIYPGLEGQYDFHLAEIKRLRDQIQDDLQTFSKKRERRKALHKIASVLNASGGTISVLAGGSSVVALAGAISAPIAIPLGCISLGAGVVTALSTYTLNNCSKGREKYSRLIEIANSVSKRISLTISEALKDRLFSEAEYRKIVDEYEQYRKDIRAVRKRNRTKTTKNSQEEFLKALRQTLDEKQDR